MMLENYSISEKIHCFPKINEDNIITTAQHKHSLGLARSPPPSHEGLDWESSRPTLSQQIPY